MYARVRACNVYTYYTHKIIQIHGQFWTIDDYRTTYTARKRQHTYYIFDASQFSVYRLSYIYFPYGTLTVAMYSAYNKIIHRQCSRRSYTNLGADKMHW